MVKVKAKFVDPMLLLSMDQLPAGDEWFYEMKSSSMAIVPWPSRVVATSNSARATTTTSTRDTPPSQMR
jgi:hypothetical protein